MRYFNNESVTPIKAIENTPIKEAIEEEESVAIVITSSAGIRELAHNTTS
jgi:hypothetical protein